MVVSDPALINKLHYCQEQSWLGNVDFAVEPVLIQVSDAFSIVPEASLVVVELKNHNIVSM